MRTLRSIFAASLVLVLGSVASTAPAQDKWPSKPIRMIVPFTPGAASDVLGRIVAQRLTEIEIFGQQLVKAKIDVVHVPFCQGPDSRNALISGTIQFYIYPLPAIVTLIREIGMKVQ